MNNEPIEGINGGFKQDGGKPDWTLLDLLTFEGTIRVLQQGAKKYSRDNWKNLEPERIFGATLRHLFAWWYGRELFDIDKKYHFASSHLDNAICELYFLKWLELHRYDLFETFHDLQDLSDVEIDDYVLKLYENQKRVKGVV